MGVWSLREMLTNGIAIDAQPVFGYWYYNSINTGWLNKWRFTIQFSNLNGTYPEFTIRINGTAHPMIRPDERSIPQYEMDFGASASGVIYWNITAVYGSETVVSVTKSLTLRSCPQMQFISPNIQRLYNHTGAQMKLQLSFTYQSWQNVSPQSIRVQINNVNTTYLPRRIQDCWSNPCSLQSVDWREVQMGYYYLYLTPGVASNITIWIQNGTRWVSYPYLDGTLNCSKPPADLEFGFEVNSISVAWESNQNTVQITMNLSATTNALWINDFIINIGTPLNSVFNLDPTDGSDTNYLDGKLFEGSVPLYGFSDRAMWGTIRFRGCVLFSDNETGMKFWGYVESPVFSYNLSTGPTGVFAFGPGQWFAYAESSSVKYGCYSGSDWMSYTIIEIIAIGYAQGTHFYIS